MTQSSEQGGADKKTKQNKTQRAVKRLCDRLYAQCLDNGLLSKLWNILE